MGTQESIDNAADEEEAAALRAALEMSTEDIAKTPDLEPVGPLLPDNFQGYYELFGVVTHKGRNADGGHYMGWVKADPIKEDAAKGGKKNDEAEQDDNWYVFDDDEVSPCKTED